MKHKSFSTLNIAIPSINALNNINLRKKARPAKNTSQDLANSLTFRSPSLRDHVDNLLVSFLLLCYSLANYMLNYLRHALSTTRYWDE